MKKRLFTSIFLALMALFALPVEVWGDEWSYDFYEYCKTDGSGSILEGKGGQIAPSLEETVAFTANSTSFYNISTPAVNNNLGIATEKFKLSNYYNSESDARIGLMASADGARIGFQNLTTGYAVVLVANAEPTVEGSNISLKQEITGSKSGVKYGTNTNRNISNWNTYIYTLSSAGSASLNFSSGNTIYSISVTSLYTVTYDGNGNTSGSAPTDSNSPYVSGNTVTVLDNTGSLAKTGYTFSGWNTSAEGTGTEYAAGVTFNISENTTLYAKWTVNSAGEEQSVSTATVWTFNNMDATTYTASATEVTASNTNGGTAYIKSHASAVTRQIEIDEITEKSYTFGNGTNVSVSKIAKAGGKINSPDTGNDHVKTATAGNNDTGYLIPTFAFNTSVAGTVYALMKGTKDDVFACVKSTGTSAIREEYATKATGNEDPDPVQFSVSANTSVFIGDKTNACEIYAIRFVPTRTVTINSDVTANVTSDKATAGEGDKITLTVTPPDGKQVATLKANNEDITLDSEGKYTFTMPDKNVTITASFVPVYTITFDSNGGSTVESITKAAGEDIAKPADPTKENCTFAGWYKGETAYEFPSTMPAENIALTAHWTEIVSGNSVTISSSITNGTITSDKTSEVTSGSEVTLTVAPQSGYQLKTLSINDGAVSYTTSNNLQYKFNMPSSSVTVTAEFEAEATISELTTWKFDDTTAYPTSEVRGIRLKDGLYMRNKSDGTGRNFKFADSDETTAIEFSNDKIQFTPSRMAIASGKGNISNSVSTAGGTGTLSNNSVSDAIPFFAFNASVPGTVYALVKGVTDSKCRIYFVNGTTKVGESNTNKVNKEGTNGVMELKYTSSEAGSFFIGSMDNACQIYAIRFVPTHTLTSEVDPTDNATITMKDGSTAVDSGTSIEEGKTITIEVSGIANGYEIDHVKVNDGDAMTATNGKYSFTMPTADATVKVTLKKKSYTLTAATVDNGSISFTVDGIAATTAEFGDEVTIISNPNANYQLSTLTGTYGTESTTLSITDNKFTMPDGDVTITATFVSTAVVPTTSDYGTFTFTGLGDSDGIVPNWGATLSSGTLQMLAKGNETFGNRFAAGPVNQNNTSNCFKFKSNSEWDGLYSQYDNRTFSIINLKTNDQVTITMKDDRANLKFVDGNAVENGKAYLVDADGDYNFVTTGETYIQSVKVVKTFNISISSLTNGSITADKERASAGETVTLTVTPNAGYQLKESSLKATYNDGNQNQDITITDNKFTMPGYDVTIKAEFEKTETVTAPSCEAATEGKVTTGTVTITPATTDDSAATMTTYYATSLTSAAPATDATDAWTVLPDDKTIRMEKSGYIFLYGKSSTGITTSVATIDVELPVYGTYNFGDIAGTYYNNTSTSKSASFENGELKVESTLFGLNRAFSGTNWNLRYSDATYKGLQTSSGTSTMTISRLNQYDIVKIKHNNAITASSENVTLLGSTKENEKVGEITYVINSGNSIELSGTSAWIYSVEISNEDAVSAPTITVDGNNQVTIDGGTSLQGKTVTVYYTTDGSNPTTSSTQYSSPFTAEKTVYIKAFSVVTENTNIQSPVAEKKVSVGTYTATKNVFDFAALAGDFGEFAFVETAVSLNEYWSTSVTNEDKDFYEITNTDHFTATDNTVKVLMRGKTGNTLSYTNGGMTGSNSGLIAITGLTIGQRVIVEYLNGGSVRYNTGAGKGEVTVNGTTLERGATIASGAVMTVTNGDYMVLYNVANSTITKISVLDAVATYSVTVPTSTEHGQVVADKITAEEGETVTLTVTPDAGYVVESLTVKDADNGDVTVTTVAANSSYTFVMPAKAVTITVAFTQYVEKTVNSVTNWTFDGLSGTCNEIKEVDGAYLRGSASNPTRTFTVTDINEQTLTFADGTSVTVNKYLAVNNSMYPLAFTETSTAASTATKTNSNNVEELIGAGSFAVNTTVPGTIYAKLSTESDQNVRIYCTDAISSPQTFALKAADGIQEVTYTTTAENGGTFFVGGVSSKYNIYAVRFVPTSQAVTYTLTVGSVENGTITAKIGDTTVAEGESAQVIPGSTVTLTAVPADGYQLSGWKNGSNDLGAIPQSIVTTAAMPATALTVSAAFEQQPSSVTAVTVAKTWDFESYTTGISLSGSTVYAATDGLYISGHNESAPAQVVAGSATGKLGESDVTATKCLYINGAQNGDLSSKSVNSYNQHAIGLKVGATGILYTLISGATKDGEDRYFNIYVNGVKSQTKITGTDPVVVSQAVTSADASVFISVSGGYVKLYAARFEPATVETVKIDDASEFSAVISGNEASVASVSIDEETSVITISGSVDGKDVTSIADNVFTAENTANVGAIDLSETKINLTGERGEIPALKNINSATLVYVPSTASVTGTNVVTSSGACTDYQVFDSQLSNGKPCEVPKTFTADKATLNRTFTASQKCTVCLPYSFARTGGKFYKFVGISGGKVQMAEQTTDMLEANTPYIFEPSANADGITTNTGTIAVSISDAPNTEVSSASFTFKGTYEKIEWTNPTGIYGFAAEDKDGATVGSFVRVGTGASIMACRAYLEYTGTAPINGVAATRGMTDSLPATLEIEWIPAEKGSTTGINRTELQNDDDAPVYSITGQRVDSSYKGLVIKNGKKVVRK